MMYEMVGWIQKGVQSEVTEVDEIKINFMIREQSRDFVKSVSNDGARKKINLWIPFAQLLPLLRVFVKRNPRLVVVTLLFEMT